jgi:metal-responsive CopG/Arc/MetJ family transcriptional regulator
MKKRKGTCLYPITFYANEEMLFELNEYAKEDKIGRSNLIKIAIYDYIIAQLLRENKNDQK